jgi:lipopolysaccharide export LptBFGC system permease protein LptF
MITGYFFRRFVYQGLLFFGILTAVFASCNLFVRLPVMQNLLAIPQLVLMMLPLVAMFSLPIASGLGVYTTLMQHKTRDDLLLLAYLKPASRALYKAVIAFTLLCGLLYAALVFQFAPQSYRLGKQLIVNVAKEHFLQLEPNKFHTPFPGLTFFFKTKLAATQVAAPRYTTMFLVYAPGKDERYFFTAQEGFFAADTLVLHNGSMHTIKGGRFHAANFHQMEIDFRSLLAREERNPQLAGLKFTTFKHLYALKDNDQEAFVELHKRFAQILWLMLFPFLALCGALVMRRSSLIAGVALCGSFYLVSYVLLALGQFFYDQPVCALLCFYGPILMIILGLAMMRTRYSS